jgi:hypothetical protein
VENVAANGPSQQQQQQQSINSPFAAGGGVRHWFLGVCNDGFKGPDGKLIRHELKNEG